MRSFIPACFKVPDRSPIILDAIIPFLNTNDQVDTVSFIPRSLPGKSSFPKYQDEICHGLKILNLEEPITWTMHLFILLESTYPNKFQFLDTHFIDKLYGSDQLRLNISERENITQLVAKWQEDEKIFRKIRIPYNLYP